jgi:hypothetical protein
MDGLELMQRFASVPFWNPKNQVGRFRVANVVEENSSRATLPTSDKYFSQHRIALTITQSLQPSLASGVTLSRSQSKSVEFQNGKPETLRLI